MKASIVGTVTSINIVENSCFISLAEENRWDIRSDSAMLTDFKKLQESKKYLFHGTIMHYNPTIAVSRIVQESSNLSELDTSEVALHGEIIDIKITKTMRGNELAYIKFKELPEVDIILFPEMCKEFRKIDMDDNKISIIGKFDDAQASEFIVDSIEPLE